MSTHIDCLSHVVLDFTPHSVVTFVTAEETWGSLFDDYMFSMGALRNEDYDIIGCECEIDWSCGLHAGRPTYLETRYDGMED